MASIIKAGQLKKSASGVRQAEFNLEDMSARASHHVGLVRQQVAQIIVEAKQQAQAIREAAAREGREAAAAAARQAVSEELTAKWQSLAPALQQSIDEINRVRDSWTRQWERNAIHLVVAIAERVVRGELQRRPEISARWIREALDLASSGNQIRLHLNPRDYEALGSQRETIAADFSRLSPADIVPDPDVAAGGCRVVTEFGQVDQQLHSQLARIEEELTS